jgi:CheY-like chemotaxis protein
VAAITVLITDNIKGLLQIEKNFLMRAGFEVLTAENGPKALELARDRAPRLVLLDLEMPELDGAAACAAMRREASLAQTPIIIMSAADSPEIRERCREAGCTEFVAKPRKPADLLAIVARTLSIGERRALRVSVIFKVTAELNDRRLPGKATNLSATGLLFLGETTMPLGALLGLEFLLPKLNQRIKLKGKVVRVGWLKDGTCEAGIHFTEVSEADRQTIHDFTGSSAGQAP